MATWTGFLSSLLESSFLTRRLKAITLYKLIYKTQLSLLFSNYLQVTEGGIIWCYFKVSTVTLNSGQSYAEHHRPLMIVAGHAASTVLTDRVEMAEDFKSGWLFQATLLLRYISIVPNRTGYSPRSWRLCTALGSSLRTWRSGQRENLRSAGEWQVRQRWYTANTHGFINKATKELCHWLPVIFV